MNSAQTPTETKKNLIFLFKPSVVIISLSIILFILILIFDGNTIFTAAAPSIAFLFFIFYQAYKNGAFEFIQYMRNHGHHELWKTHYSEEIQFLQILLTGATSAGIIFWTINNQAHMSPYGKFGLFICAGIFLLAIVIITIQQNKDYGANVAFRGKCIYETMMLIAYAGTAILFSTEIYLTWKTPYVFFPSIMMMAICFSLINTEDLPRQTKFKKLKWQMSIVFTLTFMSLVTQFWNYKVLGWGLGKSISLIVIIVLIIIGIIRYIFNPKKTFRAFQ